MIRRASLSWLVLLVALVVGAQIKLPPSMIVWNESRKLTWQDFQMPPPANRNADSKTTAEIWHEDRWLCPSTKLHTTIVAVFNRDESWAIDEVKSDDRLLRHEKLHFDLAEVYARILRKKLSAFKIPCRYEKSVIQAQIKVIADNNIKDLQVEQDRYDVETKHGLNEKAQTEWERQVKARLQLGVSH